MKNAEQKQRDRPIAIWLLAGVCMIMVQIVLGGITRLTDSGLSITEWKPVLGTMPPSSNEQWTIAFEKYKQIAQFKQIHSYFTLEDFKSIYFWEWLHRNWGKFIGIVFLIPFIIFLIQKRFHAAMIKPMIILFLLGGLQGLIGWLMVQSGLNEENLYVSHIRLAIHFITALGLLVYTFWFALRLLIPGSNEKNEPPSRKLIITIISLLVIQLVYGAFMAGLKAATVAPNWPLINGAFIPSNMGHYAGRNQSFFSMLVNDPIVVHFIHRNLAYFIFILISWWTVRTQKINLLVFRTAKWLPLFFAVIQIILGIAAVLLSIQKRPQHWGSFEWSAALHQFCALFLLLSLVLVLFLSRKQKANSLTSV